MVLQGKLNPKSTLYDGRKLLKKSKSMPPQLNGSTRTANGSSVAALKSRIKHMAPICKTRTKHKKERTASNQSESNPDDFDWLFDNQDECLWLSSESLADFRVLSPRDYGVDDECLLVALRSSWIDCRSNLFDGAKANPIKEASLTLEEEEGQKWLLAPIDSSCDEDLEPDFPSPTFKMNSVMDVDVASLNDASNTFLMKNGDRKVHPNDLLKRRIIVASGLSASKIVEFKRGNRRIAIASRNTKFNDPKASGKLIKVLTSAGSMHNKLDKSNLLMSIKRPRTRKRTRTMSLGGASDTSFTSSMDFDSAGWSISLIDLNEEESQWISEVESDMENFPSPSYKNQQVTQTNIEDSGSLEILSMEADEPLFWPYGKDHNWSMTWDNFNVSPRKSIVGIEARNSSSIRVRIHDQRVVFRSRVVGFPGLSASKITGFKRRHCKKSGGRRGKVMRSRLGRRNLAQKMDFVMVDEDEEDAVESMLGLCEFDGHEGVDVEFQTDDFSILEE